MKAVIFDMDGVMFDTEALGKQMLESAADGTEYQIIEHYSEFSGLNERALIEKMAFYLGDEEKALELLRMAEQKMKAYYHNHSVPVKEGLEELLSFLQDMQITTAIASSSSRRAIKNNLKSAGINHPFRLIISGEEVYHSKPEPEIYLTTCTKLNVHPEECYIIEDSKNGLLAGYRAGCKTIFVPDLWRPQKGEETDYIYKQCDSLKEVKELIHNDFVF